MGIRIQEKGNTGEVGGLFLSKSVHTHISCLHWRHCTVKLKSEGSGRDVVNFPHACVSKYGFMSMSSGRPSLQHWAGFSVLFKSVCKFFVGAPAAMTGERCAKGWVVQWWGFGGRRRAWEGLSGRGHK